MWNYTTKLYGVLVYPNYVNFYIPQLPYLRCCIVLSCAFHQPIGFRLISGSYSMFDGQLFHQFLNELIGEL
jgi:hypothetical protein